MLLLLSLLGMCEILFLLVKVLHAAADASGNRILLTTEMRDSMAFHYFIRLMRVHGVESCFAPGVHHVRTSNQSKYFSRGLHFSMLLKTHRPKLFLHLSKISIDIGTVVSPWFRTLLSDFVVLQESTVLRIWDNFFTISETEGKAKGWDVIYRCLIVVFSMLEDQLMELGLEGTMKLLWNIKSEREDVFNIDASKLLQFGNELLLHGVDEEDDFSEDDVLNASLLLMSEEESDHTRDEMMLSPPKHSPPPNGLQARIGLFE